MCYIHPLILNCTLCPRYPSRSVREKVREPSYLKYVRGIDPIPTELPLEERLQRTPLCGPTLNVDSEPHDTYTTAPSVHGQRLTTLSWGVASLTVQNNISAHSKATQQLAHNN